MWENGRDFVEGYYGYYVAENIFSSSDLAIYITESEL